MEPAVTKIGLIDMQVCVPSQWNNARVHTFAERLNPCGTVNGWGIRLQGDEALQGADERVPCEKRKEFVHIMLDAF